MATPTLVSERLLLRPVHAADADGLFALMSSPRVLRYWDSLPWNDYARAERFIESSAEMAGAGTGVRVAIQRTMDSGFIGWIAFRNWNPTYRSAKLGYCLAEEAWGCGYASEAGEALLRWAFDNVDVNRVQAEVDTRNSPSARVLEKLGFVREGTLREDCIVGDEVSDSWVYGLLRNDWLARGRQLR